MNERLASTSVQTNSEAHLPNEILTSSSTVSLWSHQAHWPIDGLIFASARTYPNLALGTTSEIENAINHRT